MSFKRMFEKKEIEKIVEEHSGGGTQLYFHKINLVDGEGNRIVFSVITAKEDAYETFDELASMYVMVQDKICSYFDTLEGTTNIAIINEVVVLPDMRYVALIKADGITTELYNPFVNTDAVVPLV